MIRPINPALRFLDHDAECARIRAIVEDRARELLRESDAVEAGVLFEIFLRAVYPREAFEWKPRSRAAR